MTRTVCLFSVNVLQHIAVITKPGNTIWSVSGVLLSCLEFLLVHIYVFWGTVYEFCLPSVVESS